MPVSISHGKIVRQVWRIDYLGRSSIVLLQGGTTCEGKVCGRRNETEKIHVPEMPDPLIVQDSMEWLEGL